MKKKSSNLVLLLAVLFTCTIVWSGNSVFAQINVVLEPDRDNTLYEDATGSISNGAGQFIFAGRTAALGGGLIRRALLHFDIAGTIPAGAVIQSAALTLNMSRTISGNELHMLHPLQADWGEGASNAPGQEGSGTASMNGDATWKHTFFPLSFWSTDGGDVNMGLTTNLMVGGLGSYTWGSSTQIVSDVQGWLDNPANNFGWLLMGNEALMTTAKRFDSRENPVAGNRPKLSITYVIPNGTCCVGDVGDPNLSGDVTVGDISQIVDQLFGSGTVVTCLDEGDVNLSRSGTEAFASDITVGDISAIVDHLFGSGNPLAACL